MKITHALRPDSRWDTYRQSRTRSTQRTLRDDTLDQLDDMVEGDLPVATGDYPGVVQHDRYSWEAWGQAEYMEWLDYICRR